MKKRSRIYLIIVLFAAITLSLFTSACEKMPDTRPEKIDEALWEHMQTVESGELIPITIMLYDVGDDAIISKIKEITGYDPDIYMNEDRFQKEIVSEIKATLEKAIGVEEANKADRESEESRKLSKDITDSLRSAFEGELKHLVKDPENIIKYAESDPSLSVIDYTILKIRCDFQAAKNRTVREVQTAQSNEFIEHHVKNRGNTVKYASTYTPIIFLSANKSDIVYYSRLSEIVDIHYDDPDVAFTSSLNTINIQVGTD